MGVSHIELNWVGRQYETDNGDYTNAMSLSMTWGYNNPVWLDDNGVLYDQYFTIALREDRDGNLVIR